MKHFYFFILIFAFACTSKPPKNKGADAGVTTQGKPLETKGVSMESKLLASEEESNLVTEISFQKSKAFISDAARKELNALHQKASKRGKIEEIKVITWGDLEYPSKQDEKLSDNQMELVKMRNDALEKYFDTLASEAKVETISMAERPSALNKYFSGDDAEIKKSLESAGIPTTDSKDKVPGKASKSVVIFIMEE